MHPTTEQECLAFGLYIVAVRLSCYYGNTCLAFGLYIVAVRLLCTSEARATQWRILVQVVELVWAEIPGARNPNSSLTDPFFDSADYKTLT